MIEELKNKTAQAVEQTPRIYQVNNQLRDHVGQLAGIKNRLRQVVVQLGGGWPENDQDSEEKGKVSGEECSLDLLAYAVDDFGCQLRDIEDYLNRLKELV